MRRRSCGRAGLQRRGLSQAQVRQGSAFTESLGERTDSETSAGQGDPDTDVGGFAASESSSAFRAASGESQRQYDSAPSVHMDRPSLVVGSHLDLHSCAESMCAAVIIMDAERVCLESTQ